MSTSFGLADKDITDLVTGMRSGRGDPHEAQLELFARAAFGTLVEPADRVATLLIESLGAADALAAVVERRPVAAVVDAIASASMAEGAPELAGAEAPLEPGSAEKRLVRELGEAFARWVPRLNSQSVMAALRTGKRAQARLVAPWDEEWPEGLDDLQQHAPLMLWVRGSEAALAATTRSLALVGARAATGYGEYLAVEAAAGAVDRGLAVVSGGAYGIDGAAHRSALASAGMTVAFMAGGVDRLYPAGHEALLTRIAAEGALVSELPCGSSPSRWRFLQRNRLIAACSSATVVLEAGRRSGAINTAGHAAQLGRPLAAVPGPVTSAASAGCHRLIREFGAICVTSPAEMAELVPDAVADGELYPVNAPSAPNTSRHLDAGSRLRSVLRQRTPRTAEELAAAAGLSVAEVRAQLGLLQLAGEASERGKGWVAKEPTPR